MMNMQHHIVEALEHTLYGPLAQHSEARSARSRHRCGLLARPPQSAHCRVSSERERRVSHQPCDKEKNVMPALPFDREKNIMSTIDVHKVVEWQWQLAPATD
mmetsp:Transcript_96172/g.155193  ORF Transcript_96172/g.155193 Transcript_96172/m.155193 type:complete len:102 (-) Transcript_96172:92-397(-)